MALLPNINVGSAPNDGTGDSIRDAFTIVNENFQFIEAFFPNTSNIGLTANITSTGTSTFNIANVDVLNVNTISSYTTTNITVTNIAATNITTTDITATNITVIDTGTFDVVTANTLNATVIGNVSTNVTSTGNSSFNITSHSGAATFDDTLFVLGTLTADIIDANIENVDTVNSLGISTNTFVTNSATINGNFVSNGFYNFFTSPVGVTIVSNWFKANSLFYTNTVTISTDVNLATTDYNRAQTIVANLTAGNLTVTLPNASTSNTSGLTYTFICYDEGGLDNRTLTVNVQPGAGNIWTSANTQATFVNVSAELGTSSVELKNNLTYWFKY